MIYFVRCEQNRGPYKSGWIKIGVTARLSVRLKQIANEIGHTPTVLGVLDGAYAEERALHQRFATARAMGEWFSPCHGILQIIETEVRPWDDDEDELVFISIKTTVAFHDWIAKIASAERSTIVQILEKGVVEYGDKRGFKDAPKRTVR